MFACNRPGITTIEELQFEFEVDDVDEYVVFFFCLSQNDVSNHSLADAEEMRCFPRAWPVSGPLRRFVPLACLY